MENKKCSVCHEIKLKSEYHKSNSSKDGLQYTCKDCKGIISKKVSLSKLNLPSPNVNFKTCLACNTTKSIGSFAISKQTSDNLSRRCTTCNKNNIVNFEYNESDTLICKHCNEEKHISEFNKVSSNVNGFNSSCRICYTDKNKVLKYEYDKMYRFKNSNTIKSKKSAYKKKNRNKINLRRKNDPILAMSSCVRSRVTEFLNRKGFSGKKESTSVILGCSYEKLKSHLENKFTENMNWENRGSYWHIDHVIPLNFSKCKNDVLTLSHYSNLQPLQAALNIAKGDSINHADIESHFNDDKDSPAYKLYLSRILNNSN
jgi:hypothetical protein